VSLLAVAAKEVGGSALGGGAVVVPSPVPEPELPKDVMAVTR